MGMSRITLSLALSTLRWPVYMILRPLTYTHDNVWKHENFHFQKQQGALHYCFAVFGADAVLVWTCDAVNYHFIVVNAAFYF